MVQSRSRPEKAQDEVVKVGVAAEDEVDEVEVWKEKLKVEVDARTRMHEELVGYRVQMNEIQGHLEMVERLVEDKEDRYAEEMEAE